MNGWRGDARPTPTAGLQVSAFATGLDHPWWLHVLPNGDVLVAETNAPARPDDATGIKGWFFKKFQKKAGAGVPSANRITLLAVNERDELGTDIVPDYMTAGRDGGFYGWPYSYYGQHVDDRVKPPRQHGSWNREPSSGYRVIFVPFAAGRPAGAPIDVLTGFLDRVGNAQGRPVGVAIDRRGALLVVDDVGNTIWRVTASTPVPVVGAR